MTFADYQSNTDRLARQGATEAQRLCAFALGISDITGEITSMISGLDARYMDEAVKLQQSASALSGLVDKYVHRGADLDREAAAKHLSKALFLVSRFASVLNIELETIAQMGVKGK